MDPNTPTKRAKPRKALTAANLELLGAERLTAILLEVADGQPTTKRRLRMELAARVGPEALVAEIEKPLGSMKAAQSRVHWRKLKALLQDLGALRAMIAGQLAQADPAAAVGLLLRFLSLERGVLARVSDTKGDVASIFVNAMADLARIAPAVETTPPGFVAAIMAALDEVSAGAMGPLTQGVIPALAPAAIAQLRASIETQMGLHRRVNAGWRAALQVLLDAQGDALAYAATYSPSESVLPPVGARIAQRFLKAGKLAEAARALERSNPTDASAGGRQSLAPSDPGLAAWQGAWIDLMEARGEKEAAQAARWSAFERNLSAEQFRAYLRRLSGFDDVVATDRALEHAASFKPFANALAFLVAWPAMKEAADLVTTRASEIDGATIEILEPAARALEGRYPLAATLLLRAMVRDVARFSQAELFGRARGWLLEAASLASQIDDFGEHGDHADFEARVSGILRR